MVSTGQLRCRAVVGSANNQLTSPAMADLIEQRGIVYGPDFVVNAGGLINAAEERTGYDAQRAAAAVATIRQITRTVLDRAEGEQIPSDDAALRLAEDRIATINAIRLPRS